MRFSRGWSGTGACHRHNERRCVYGARISKMADGVNPATTAKLVLGCAESIESDIENQVGFCAGVQTDTGPNGSDLTVRLAPFSPRGSRSAFFGPAQRRMGKRNSVRVPCQSSRHAPSCRTLLAKRRSFCHTRSKAALHAAQRSWRVPEGRVRLQPELFLAG